MSFRSCVVELQGVSPWRKIRIFTIGKIFVFFIFESGSGVMTLFFNRYWNKKLRMFWEPFIVKSKMIRHKVEHKFYAELIEFLAE